MIRMNMYEWVDLFSQFTTPPKGGRQANLIAHIRRNMLAESLITKLTFPSKCPTRYDFVWQPGNRIGVFAGDALVAEDEAITG